MSNTATPATITAADVTTFPDRHAFVESGPGQEPTTVKGCIVCPACYLPKRHPVHGQRPHDAACLDCDLQFATAEELITHCRTVHTSTAAQAESTIWACARSGCTYRIADGPVDPGEPTTDDLIAQHLDEHDDAAAARPELTGELAEVLAAVADGTLDLASDPDELEPAWRRRVAAEKRAARLAALSLLAHLGYVNPILDGTWAIETAGNDALAARRAAVEAEGRRKVADSYQAVAAELHAIADAIATVPTDGLVELQVLVDINTTYAVRGESDPAKVATVDAVAGVLLGTVGATRQLNTSTTWMHEAKGRRGPVTVEVDAFIEDPGAREKEAAERERVAEVERLKAELAALRVEANRAFSEAAR